MRVQYGRHIKRGSNMGGTLGRTLRKGPILEGH